MKVEIVIAWVLGEAAWDGCGAGRAGGESERSAAQIGESWYRDTLGRHWERTGLLRTANGGRGPEGEGARDVSPPVRRTSKVEGRWVAIRCGRAIWWRGEWE